MNKIVLRVIQVAFWLAAAFVSYAFFDMVRTLCQ